MKIQTLLLVMLICLPYSTSSGQQVLTKADSARWGSYWWHSKDMFEKLPDTKNEIIFLGNSITDGAEWFEIFNDKRCKNRGISGDVT
ncbi:MAG: sialate O-acetylesterase, partial [Bacteroidales bacterium]